MVYRAAAGRPIRRPVNVVTARDYLRRLLTERGLGVKGVLDKAWDVHYATAYRYMTKGKSRLTPAHIDSAIEALNLDALEATKLKFLSARDAGWDMDLKFLKLL